MHNVKVGLSLFDVRHRPANSRTPCATTKVTAKAMARYSTNSVRSMRMCVAVLLQTGQRVKTGAAVGAPARLPPPSKMLNNRPVAATASGLSR